MHTHGDTVQYLGMSSENAHLAEAPNDQSGSLITLRFFDLEKPSLFSIFLIKSLSLGLSTFLSR